MDRQPGGVGVGDQGRGRAQHAARRRDHQRPLRTQTLGEGGDGLDPGGGFHVDGGRALGHQHHPARAAAESVEGLQRLDLEALDEDRRAPAVFRLFFLERVDQPAFQRQADAGEVGRVLHLRIGADGPAGAAALGLRQVDDLLVGRDRLAAVERRADRPQRRQTLAGAQRLQLGEGEVLGEPAGDRLAVDDLSGLAGGELAAGRRRRSCRRSRSRGGPRDGRPSSTTRSGSMKSAPSSMARR